MNSTIRVSIIIGLFLLTIGGFAKDMKSSSLDKSNLALHSYTVATVIQHPDKFTGEFDLVGVVSLVYPGKNLFVVIDTTEFEECGRTDCADEQVPVQWNQSMPKVRDIVNIQGQIKKTDKGYIFIAKQVKTAPAGKENGKSKRK